MGVPSQYSYVYLIRELVSFGECKSGFTDQTSYEFFDYRIYINIHGSHSYKCIYLYTYLWRDVPTVLLTLVIDIIMLDYIVLALPSYNMPNDRL